MFERGEHQPDDEGEDEQADDDAQRRVAEKARQASRHDDVGDSAPS